MQQDLPLVLDNVRKMAARDDLAAAVIHLNDTYLLEANDRGLPGMARIATLVDMIREEVARCTGLERVLVLHSGDFMMPSRLGVISGGAAMTDMLARFVDVIALGNHEFDLGVQALADRIVELRARGVRVVCSNVLFPEDSFPQAPLRRSVLEPVIFWPTAEDPLFAILGVLGNGLAPKLARVEPAEATVKSVIDDGFGGARRLIILSHDDRRNDLELMQTVDDSLSFGRGFAYLLGGHDHHVDWSQKYTGVHSKGYAVFSKCRSNARSLRVFLVSRSQLIVDELRRLQRPAKLGLTQEDLERHLTQTHASVLRNLRSSAHLGERARAIHAKIARENWHDTASQLTGIEVGCDVGIRLGGDALAGIVPAVQHEAAVARLIGDRSPRTKGPERSTFIDVTDNATRSRPTPFGRFVTSCVRAGTGADMALIHGGSFRGDDMFGPDLDNHLLEDVFIYDGRPVPWLRADGTRVDVSSIIVAMLPAKTVRDLLVHGREKKRQSGGFPQVSLTTEEEQALGKRQGEMRVAIASYLVCDPHDGYRAILEAGLQGSFQASVDAWTQSSSSITSLVEQHWSEFSYLLDEEPPGGGSSDSGALDALFEACMPLRGYFQQNPHLDVRHEVLGEIKGANFASSPTWRELITYRRYPMMTENALASRCPDLLAWWKRMHDEWQTAQLDPLAKLRELRYAAEKIDRVVGEIAEALQDVPVELLRSK